MEFVEDGIRYKEEYGVLMVMGFADIKRSNKSHFITLVIPDEVRGLHVAKIAPYAFVKENRIQTVSFSENMEHIGTLAFGNCENLESITITSSHRFPMGLNVALKIDSEAFLNCKNLRAVDGRAMSNGIILASGVFKDCEKLNTLYLWIQEAHDYAFMNTYIKRIKFQPNARLHSKCLSYANVPEITLHDDCKLDSHVWEDIKNNNIKILCLSSANLTSLAYEGYKIEIL